MIKYTDLTLAYILDHADSDNQVKAPTLQDFKRLTATPSTI